MKYSSLIALLMIWSCNRSDNGQQFGIIYVGKNHKAVFFIPQKISENENSEEEGSGTLFCYVGNDSSFVYFSINREIPTPNDCLIKKQKHVLCKELLSDSTSFEGKDSLNTYWKEIINKGVVYGYSKVYGNKKKLYDNVLKSVKVN